MRFLWWIPKTLILVGAVCCLLTAPARAGTPPNQKLPSALLIFPLIESDGDRDTRIELLNLSGESQQVQCFYVDGDSCNEIGFFLSLTPFQPIAWLASEGLSNTRDLSAAPPFFGSGQLKCAVIPPHPEVQFHNTIQGRATIFGLDGRTVSLGAVGFQRLTDGDFTGVVALNGSTYAQCPEKLHFHVLANRPGSTSELILVPCSQDLLLQSATAIPVQFQIINEFEQSFSTSFSVTCSDRRALRDISAQLDRSSLGSDTAHMVVRGSTGPLIGLVIDDVPFGITSGTAGNEPSFQGGRSATVVFP